MDRHAVSILSLSMKPSAFLPTMSLIALSVVIVHILRFGVVREADEASTAHIWQLLMAGQLPVLAYFVIRWLPREPWKTVYVAALQIGAALGAAGAVYFLEL